jgi:hypothetical protein
VLALILLALADAFAGSRVIHGATAPKTDAVGKALGVPAAEVELAPITGLANPSAPRLGGSGQMTACSGAATTNADVEKPLAGAEDAFAYLEYDKALKELDAAAAALKCLSEPVKPNLPARVWYIRGVVRFHLNDQNGAKDAFTEAFSLQPDLLWDSSYAPAPKSVFDAAQGAAQGRKPATLLVYGKDARVDGRVVAGRVDLPGGAHVLQLGASAVTTYELRVSPGASATLVLPGGVTASAVDLATSESGKAALGGILDAVDAGDVVDVAIGGELWRVAVASNSWTLVGPIGPTPKAKGGGGGFDPGFAVAGGGVALAAGGGALWAIGLGHGKEAIAAGEGAPEPLYSDAQADYRSAKTLVMLGVVGTAAGLGAVGGGVAMISDVSILPVAWGGGGGLVVSGRLP